VSAVALPARNVRAKGFTLAELAIALVIVGLLLASALIPISAQLELKTIADTQRTLDQIRESLIGFALANGRLPCPALGTDVTSGSSLAGQEVTAGTSPNIYCTAAAVAAGVVPWATLGLPETDAWGRRFSYRVAPIFADGTGCLTWESKTTANVGTCAAAPEVSAGAQSSLNTCVPSPEPTQSSFALCSLGDLAVYTRAESNHAVSAYGLRVAAVVISHGKNGYGAYQPNGVKVGTTTSGTDEYANANGGATSIFSAGSSFSTPSMTNRIFISRAQYRALATDSACNDGTSGTPSCEFDDLVSWVPTTLLVSRMVSAGKLP
jgi:prepilin-type N-terminal cleavage/methylation domain-containing protein